MKPNERLELIETVEPCFVSGSNVKWLIERVKVLTGALEEVNKKDQVGDLGEIAIKALDK